MAELKTKPNDESIEDFLSSLPDEKKRNDSFKIHELMQEITGDSGKMWGGSIVGYGSYHYKYKSGREGDWFLTGFSPRKQNLSLYIMTGFEKYEELLSDLGKFKTSKGCLYIKKLEDVNIDVLYKLISSSVDFLKSKKWD